jgi:hypothetical protein
LIEAEENVAIEYRGAKNQFERLLRLHAPMPDEGAMISLEKPEIRNVLKIGWTVLRGILELAIM